MAGIAAAGDKGAVQISRRQKHESESDEEDEEDDDGSTASTLGQAAAANGGSGPGGAMDMDASSDEEEELAESQMVAGVYDSETGALTRAFVPFRTPAELAARGYGRTRDLDAHPFLKPQVILTIGTTGSGKSTLNFNLLDEIVRNCAPHKLGQVIVYSGSPGDPLLAKVDRDMASVFGPDQSETLLTRMGELNRYDQNGQPVNGMKGIPEDERPLHVILLDDANNNPDLAPDRAKGTAMGQAIVSHRHNRTVIIFSSQKYNNIPTLARQVASHVFFFPGNPKDMKEILANITVPPDQIKKAAEAIMRSKTRDFLWINNSNRSVMRGFTQVVVR